MSTNALIAYVDPVTRKATATVVHWDGYIEHTGNMLAQHYNTPRDAEAICSMGYLSYVDENVDIQGGVDTPIKYDSLDEMIRLFNHSYEFEYLYVYFGGQWSVLSSDHPVYPVNSAA